jgi:hypothetical protein
VSTRRCAEPPREKRLAVVEGAGHLFEGPGELEAVADEEAHQYLGGVPQS